MLRFRMSCLLLLWFLCFFAARCVLLARDATLSVAGCGADVGATLPRLFVVLDATLSKTGGIGCYAFEYRWRRRAECGSFADVVLGRCVSIVFTSVVELGRPPWMLRFRG